MMLRITIASLFVFATSTLSPPAAQAQITPEAEAIFQAYVDATGGEAAYKRLKNRRALGSIEFTGAGIGGTLEILQAEPARLRTTLNLDGIGEIRQGTDGDVAWEINPVTGPRVLEGNERANMMREALFNAELKWNELYEAAEVAGEEEIDGTACHVVKITPKEGNEITNFYAKDSGLLLKTATEAETPMGPVPVEIILNNYEEVDGLKIPFTSTQRVLTQEIKTTLETIEHNVDLPESAFAIPEEIKPLIVD